MVSMNAENGQGLLKNFFQQLAAKYAVASLSDETLDTLTRHCELHTYAKKERRREDLRVGGYACLVCTGFVFSLNTYDRRGLIELTHAGQMTGVSTASSLEAPPTIIRSIVEARVILVQRELLLECAQKDASLALLLFFATQERVASLYRCATLWSYGNTVEKKLAQILLWFSEEGTKPFWTTQMLIAQCTALTRETAHKKLNKFAYRGILTMSGRGFQEQHFVVVQPEALREILLTD